MIPTGYAEYAAQDRGGFSGNLAELLAKPDLEESARWPVVRDRAERTPLPKWLRIAVLKRDGFTCKFCYEQGGRLEVDHIIPWSAGGPDASWNLRTLCHACNQGRSNFRGFSSRTLPIILMCMECEGLRRGYDPEDDDDWADLSSDIEGGGPRHNAWCDRCQWNARATFAQIDADPCNQFWAVA